MPWTENEKQLAPQFDRALSLRDAGMYGEALTALSELIQHLDQADKTLLLHAHMQSGYISGLLGDAVRKEFHFRCATRVAPRSELASLGLFHALVNLQRRADALQEVVRFVSLRDSDDYRELLARGFAEDLPAHERALADQARALLAVHGSKA